MMWRTTARRGARTPETPRPDAGTPDRPRRLGPLGRVLTALLWTMLLAACGGAQPRDRIPRQRTVEQYVAMLEGDGRVTWQKPAELVAALEIRPGQEVADVGSGSGYFLPFLADAAGPTGRVVAQDIDPEHVEVLAARIERDGFTNVETLLGDPDDPGLPAAAFDVILLVDVYHHVPETGPFLRSLRDALAPGGRLAIVDFPPGDHVPNDVAGARHRIAKERVIAEAEAAGLALHRDHTLLEYQFFIELTRGEPGSAGSSSESSESSESP